MSEELQEFRQRLIEGLEALRGEVARVAGDCIDDAELTTALVERVDALVGMARKEFPGVLPTSPDIWSWPTRDKVVTQHFGENPGLPAYRNLKPPGHEGLDIATRSSLDVYACYAGKVYMVAEWPNRHPYGFHMRIESQMPNGRNLKVAYAHLEPGSARVKVGDLVKPGQMLARVGRTGNITGLHLHVTFKVNDAIVDPWPFLERAAG